MGRVELYVLLFMAVFASKYVSAADGFKLSPLSLVTQREYFFTCGTIFVDIHTAAWVLE